MRRVKTEAEAVGGDILEAIWGELDVLADILLGWQSGCCNQETSL